MFPYYLFLHATQSTLLRITLLLGAVGGLRVGFIWWRGRSFRAIDYVLLSTYLIVLATCFFNSLVLYTWHLLEFAAAGSLMRPVALLLITALVYLLRSRVSRAMSEPDARRWLGITYMASLMLLLFTLLSF